MLIVGGVFCGFWTHGGQTLGLRAWHLRVVREDGAPLRWADTLGVARLLIELPPADEAWLAVRDRLSRATQRG